MGLEPMASSLPQNHVKSTAGNTSRGLQNVTVTMDSGRSMIRR